MTNMSEKIKKFSVISLGCPKNLVDSEIFFSILKQAGYVYTDDLEIADTILINTCGFIKDAQEESVNTILNISLHKKNKLRKLIVTGCLVKRFKEELTAEIPEVDYWLDLKDFDSLKSILNSDKEILQKRELLTLPHYAFLRISDGCNNRCSYCAIPDIRGEHRSEKIEYLLDEAKHLSGLGVKELIVNAQDTTMYGADIYGKSMLTELLKKIEDLNLFPWIRLLYLHPAHLTEEIIDSLSELRTLLPYFDIPLQHISTEILNSMNRKIDKEMTVKRLNYLRQKFPGCAIRTTFITGFPGESRTHFKELENFIKDFKFTRLGAFTYSSEEGTPAHTFEPKVSSRTAQNRKDKLMVIQQEISADIMTQFTGKTIDVIIDKKSDEEQFSYEGRSFMDAPEIDGTVFILNGDCNPGDIVKVKILEAWEYDLVGEIIK